MRFKKYLKEGGGRFEYGSKRDQEQHRSLESLVKSNNGIFKSTKQKWFLTKGWEYGDKVGGGKDPTFRSSADVKKLRGISGVKDGEYVVHINAAMIFGKRGAGQGTRRLEWVYIVDDVGVREKYKLGFEYYKRGGSGLDLSKTKREWKRDESDPRIKDFQEDVAQEKVGKLKKKLLNKQALKKSDYVGVIGERVRGLEVEVLRKHYFETQWGRSSITVMKDNEGNMIQHFGKNWLSKGDKKKIDFTVKDHEVAEINKWNEVPYKFTSVQRIAISKEK